ncbi:MAG: winged helix-turn-helix domain-containing protein [Candidatus Nitrosotenuis sp.]
MFLVLQKKKLHIVANDPYAKRLMWFVFGGSRGGINRLRLIQQIRKTPLNANQLAKELNLDYKAILHHISVLEKNNIIMRVGEKYNVTFFVSNFLEANMDSFDEVASKLEKSK